MGIGVLLLAAELCAPVDVLVVGGTERGVRTAVAEAKAGKSVCLVTHHPYLGEDRAGTLELGFGETCPTDPLGARLWHEESGLAAFDYWADRRTDGIRWIYRNDAHHRLSEPRRPPSPADSVWFDGDVTYCCVLRKPSKVSRIEVLSLATAFVSNEGVSANFGDLSGNPAATGGVTCRVKKGARAGQTIEFRNAGKAFDVVGDYYGGRAAAISFVADVDADLEEVELVVKRHPKATRQLVSRIWFHLEDPRSVSAPPTPLKLKRTFDDELVKAGVRFLTSSPVRRVLRGADGTIVGVEIVNRSGRSEIRAKKVVDATRYGSLGGIGFAGEAEFSRVIVADGEPPSAPGMTVEKLPGEFPVAHARAKTCGRVYRCTFKLPMADGSYPSFAAAEWRARELTWTKGLMDDADLLTLRTPVRPAARPQEDALPVWGRYDVVVVGGGTAGAPAAIAAARAGAKVLVVEYRNVLGGTGTDGMITGYYDGNHCGFTEEFKAHNKTTGGRFGYYFRSETWRRLCNEAGVTVWLGAMGVGVVREGARVTGVEVGTEFGCGVVKATCVIDGTGNSDIAALAGAETTFLSEKEFALQSAGQAPQRLGYGCINSDFGFVDDSSAWDLWLFGLRARAGAPNAWDIASLPDSRERRRIVPDYMLNAQDVTSHRPFPDTVVQPCSRQDSHGYLTDDFRFISEASEEPSLYEKGVPRYAFNCNLPLRALLPKGLTAVAVIGLGAGVARDVVPIVRMQADLMNMGYGAGTAAAMAAKKGGDFRAIDFGELRKRLVDRKILRPEALAWTADVDTGSDELLAESVRTMGEGYKGSHVVWRPGNRGRARPLLQAAYRAAKTAEARQVYAKTLGLMGDGTGVETLLAVVRGEEKIADLSGAKGGAFGGGNRDMDGFLVALGRTRDPRALEPLVARLKAVPEESPVVALRGPTLALEALGDPKAAPALAEMMKREGGHGFAVKDFRTLPPIGGYGLGPEMDNCIRELALARTLWACGDAEGLAKRTLEAYAADPRGVLSAHASAVLKRRRVAQFDVRDFGAKGDGVTKGTEAVQRAIDACVAQGGGRVVITNGTFLVAPITLGRGVELHLARGAGLLGSRDLADYPNRSGIRHVETDALPRKRNCSLVFAEECEGISITGEGFIDANGENFVKPKSGDDWTGWHFERKVDLDKSLPRVVFFTGCRNVRIADMTLRNPPAGWSFWIHDCDDVIFDGVRVRADVRYPNNDGIHINSCRDVIVRNCDLETGDDSIVVRANNRSLRENKVCERVVVSNCLCRSWSAGIRIAWSNDGTIRNCTFRDIRMRDTSVGISLALPGIPEWNKYDYGREATLVEDLVFENIEMDGIYGRPILMWMSPRPDSRVEAVRRISFRNVRSTGLEKPLFLGLEGKPFEDICFKGCEFTVVGEDVLPGYRRHGAAAWDRYVGSRSRHCQMKEGGVR